MDSVRGQVEDVRPQDKHAREKGHRVSYLRQRPGPLVVRTAHSLEGEPRTIQVLPVPRKWVERKRREAGAGRIPKGFGRFGRGLGRLMMLSSGFHWGPLPAWRPEPVRDTGPAFLPRTYC